MSCEGGNEYGYYTMQHAYVNAIPFLGTVYFDASVVSYLRQQMYANFFTHISISVKFVAS